MILLSALLASLTGFVAGERPAERVQVELSAAAAVVQSGQAAVQVVARPAPVVPRLHDQANPGSPMLTPSPARSGREILDLKQSWLN